MTYVYIDANVSSESSDNEDTDISFLMTDENLEQDMSDLLYHDVTFRSTLNRKSGIVVGRSYSLWSLSLYPKRLSKMADSQLLSPSFCSTKHGSEEI
ncbi:hypothetical protein CEXT_299051 [Caerostris extrusa]|uniref:Uncharacterized protein n=1 Tax=Caerostris extrusa TaxID=172846 RepID=A0AAV4VLG7_CAEEX|nr:hypothetical protein CEXT_299051 [Caerostris extrusa]